MHYRTFMRPAGAALAVAAVTITTAPAASAEADTPHPRGPITVAHRGASAAVPENTLAAIDEARDMGIDWVENDVQRAKDGELVIMHDDTLARTTDVEQKFPDRAPWKVADFTWKEISTLDAGSWKGPEFAGLKVPNLEQYMNRVEHNDQRLVLEIKKPELYPGIEAETLKELRGLGWLDRTHVSRKLVIQAFSADSVKKVHALRPDIKTGFLGTPPVAELPQYATFADQINSNHGTVSADYYKAIHALTGPHGRRLENYTWTVDDPARAVELAKWGADGIITNKPDEIAKALAAADFEVEKNG
ncbi:glycerophosphodiester phosphodiesterase [Streptomyces sp. A7024]|uniref:Glycerophosphodiester phosphodiesterase n=1 Tax=Streptomyces coryli TaxID=1128680 RepID=A0A6G4U8W8_9ACTN|nr:glycerophosphodiester phosphodiesterase family protein [Streptomyces coryli]NGN68146.1 glycerophosphodiester phosphodiesterase [Streptomyces coryli]